VQSPEVVLRLVHEQIPPALLISILEAMRQIEGRERGGEEERRGLTR
jgi:hypothetical protein